MLRKGKGGDAESPTSLNENKKMSKLTNDEQDIIDILLLTGGLS